MTFLFNIQSSICETQAALIPRASDPPGRNGEQEDEEDSSEGSEEEEDEDTEARAEEQEHPDWPTRNMIVSFLDSFKYLTG